MTAIDPLTSGSSLAAASASPASTSTSNDIGKDTFLKLLVAQLKYQDPMSPADSTQFLAQTAQFTMVEKLSNIETEMKTNAASNEVLEAGSMIGKNVTVATQNGTPAVTTMAHVGGNLPDDAPLGTQVNANTIFYTKSGTAVPLKLEYTKLADGADGSKHWDARAFLSTTQIAGPFSVDFDSHGERTSPDPVITSAQLANVPGTSAADWDPNGLRLNMGSSSDSGRLHVSSGASSLSVLDQNGTDGQSLSGVVTGARFTASGPMLSIGGNEYALTDVTQVNVTG